MTALLETMATNAILATILAVIVFGVTRFVKKPPIVYWLWVLVLVKLATPPILHLPLKLDILKPNSDSVGVAPKEQKPRSTQRSVLLRADESEHAADISAVNAPDRQTTTPARPSGESKADLFTVESTVSPSAILGDHPVGTLWVTPRRWSWSLVLGSFWFLGSGLWFVLAATRIYRFERLIRRAEPVLEWLQQEAVALAHRFGLRQCPQIVIVQGRVPPLLWSVQRPPVVAIPAELLDRLEPVEQVMVIAHELAHFRRRDHWFRWVEMVILGLYCWHPVAWWARRKLQEAEEQCCDAWVLWAFPERPKSYARALLSTMEFLSASRTALPAGASGLGTVYDVKRRFEMILQNRVDRRMSWPVRVGLIVFASLALSLSAHIVLAELQKSEPATKSTAGPITITEASLDSPAEETQPRAARKTGGARSDALDDNNQPNLDKRTPIGQKTDTPVAPARKQPTSLKDAVAELNEKAKKKFADILKQRKPSAKSKRRAASIFIEHPTPLTVDEVIKAIHDWRPEKTESAIAAYPVYLKIADAKVLPEAARLVIGSQWRHYDDNNNNAYVEWVIQLGVMTGENKNYGLPVRKQKLESPGQALDSRPALTPAPGYTWIVNPLHLRPVPGTYDIAGLLFSIDIDQDKKSGLVVTAAWTDRNELQDLQVVAFDDKGNRRRLSRRDIGTQTNDQTKLIMARFHMSWHSSMEHLGFEAVRSKVLKD